MGDFRLELTDPPAEEPISRTEAKAHPKIEDSAEDTLIDGLITAAREVIEKITRRALVTQQWTMYLDEFPVCEKIELPFPKLQTVDSIKYYDSNGAYQTLDPSKYEVENKGIPGEIYPAYGETWPVVDTRINAVEIAFTCGYGDATDVPGPIKLALKFLVAHWYENREPSSPGIAVTEIPKTVDYLLMPYRFLRLL